MKAKLAFVLTVFSLALALPELRPAALPQVAAAPDPCLSYCAITQCIAGSGYVCGLYINSSGQQVCGCHAPKWPR